MERAKTYISGALAAMLDLAGLIGGKARKSAMETVKISFGAAVVGILAAIFCRPDDITDFLYLIGSVFTPMIAIRIADFFLLRHDSIEAAFRWENLLVWLVGKLTGKKPS